MTYDFPDDSESHLIIKNNLACINTQRDPQVAIFYSEEDSWYHGTTGTDTYTGHALDLPFIGYWANSTEPELSFNIDLNNERVSVSDGELSFDNATHRKIVNVEPETEHQTVSLFLESF